MTPDEIIKNLQAAREARRLSKVARDTGIPYRYLRNLVDGEIENPGVRQIDLLRDHFAKVVAPSRTSGKRAAS